jgi:hypothetical protein
MSYLDEQYRSRITKALLAFGFLACVFMLVLIIGGFQAIGSDEPRSEQNTITISGSGSVTAVPDTAKFTVGVSHEAETVAEAQEASTEAINEITSYLEDAGIAKENLKTTNYNISPRYDYLERTNQFGNPDRERQLTGYEVSQNIEVTVKDTEQAGQLLSGVGSRGADNVSSLRFVIEDEDAVKAEARGEAITNAKEKAKKLAKQLGVNLSDIVSFSEVDNNFPVYYRAQNESAALSAEDSAGGIILSVPPGENEVTSEVQVTYEIN